MNLNERLKNLRRERGLTQKILAQRANLSPSFISQIEKGIHHNIGSSSLLAIAKALGVKITDLFREAA